MPPAPDVRIHRDSQAWAEAAAELVQEEGTEAIRANGRFLIALSGGTTPETLYRTLASPMYVGRVDWSRTTFFFSDERCVAPDDPRSNYALARRALFIPLKIASSQVYRMPGESRDPHAAAYEYEQQLRLATQTEPSVTPSLDLILLGLGEDGHTASLFPGSPVQQEQQTLIAVTQSPIDPPTRLTMTLGVINRASVVLFLVTGSPKAQMVRRVLEPRTDADRQLPATQVTPDKGRLIWLLDQLAAAELTSVR
jgi:6-phosphogluconolactonase